MNPETRAALALQERGLSTAAIDRTLDLLGLSSHATDEEVSTAIDSLEADLPQLFAGRRAPGGRRPASVSSLDDKRSALQRAEDRAARRPAPGSPAERARQRSDRRELKLGEWRAWAPRPGGDAA